jgi:serine phosphatase RsbU (regulator of sigma subunit)
VYHGDHLTVPPGTLLLFFTDGLVERRREVIDEGLERLGAVARRWAGHHAVEAVADDVLAQMRVEDSDDDLALVVVRVVP